MGDHQRCEVVFLNDFLRESQHLGGRLGVQCGRVLIKQQQLGLLQRSHQQRDRLTLAAGQQTHLAGHALLQPQIERLEQLIVGIMLLLCDADLQRAGQAAAGRQRKIFIDLHGSRRAHHRVLKHTADVFGALMLRKACHILPVNKDLAHIHRPDTGHGVQHRGLACAVAADDRHKVAVLQRQIQPLEGHLLVDGARIESLINIFDLKHCPCLPFSRVPW